MRAFTEKDLEFVRQHIALDRILANQADRTRKDREKKARKR